MRKQALLKSVFILLPVLALGLATTTNSVVVFDSVAGTTEYYSYFDLLPVAQFQLLMPLTGVLCAMVGILAAVYLAAKKKAFLTASGFTALAASALAILPVINSADVKIIPNVGVPILMFVHYVFAYYWSKNDQKLLQERQAPRLRR